MPVGVTRDDGTEFHHVWMSMERVKEEIDKAGFKLTETINLESAEPVFICERVKKSSTPRKPISEGIKDVNVKSFTEPKTNYTINTKNDPDPFR